MRISFFFFSFVFFFFYSHFVRLSKKKFTAFVTLFSFLVYFYFSHFSELATALNFKSTHTCTPAHLSFLSSSFSVSQFILSLKSRVNLFRFLLLANFTSPAFVQVNDFHFSPLLPPPPHCW